MNRRELLISAAALPAALAFPAGVQGAARGGGPPLAALALVTSDSEDRVLVVRPSDGKVVRSIAVPDQPHGIEAAAGLRAAVVLSERSGTVTVIDAQTLEVRRVLEGFAGPRYAAGDPWGQPYAYVSDDRAGEVVTVDVQRGKVVGRVEVGEGARHIALSFDGKRVVTSLGTKAARLALVDVSQPRRPRLLRTFAAYDVAHDVAFTPDGTELWISSGAERRVTVHDARTLRPLRGLAGDAPPQHVTFDQPTGRAYVASGESGTLRIHRLADAKLLGTRQIPAGSFNVCALGGQLVTPSLTRGTLTVLDGAGLRSTRVAPNAHDACIVVRTR